MNNQIPEAFAARAVLNGRQGYAFFTAVGVPAMGDQPAAVRLIKQNHNNRFYNIQSRAANGMGWQNIHLMKQQGTVRKFAQWIHTTEQLYYQGATWPVIRIMPFMHVTAINRNCFVPRVDNEPAAPAQNPIVPNQPVPNPPNPPNPMNKKHPITGIPPHAIRALLEHALFQEAKCPILDVDIDVENGAVTSCFHIFEKTAIGQWLRAPNSQQKCPVCNTPCDAYMLPEAPPSPITILDD